MQPKPLEPTISSNESIILGIVVSLAIGAIPATLAFFSLNIVKEIGNGWAFFVALLVLAASAAAVNKLGWLPYLAPGTLGLDTTNGQMTGKVRAPGYGWAVPGIKGQIPLNVQVRKISPPPFDELIADVPVTIDVLVMGMVFDPKLYFGVMNREDALAELIEGESRIFASPWKNPDAVILQAKGMLPDYLMLPPRSEDTTGARQAFWQRLLKFTKPDKPEEKPDLPIAAAKAIMANAGTFMETALGWGMMPTLSKVKRFDLPTSVKELGVTKLISAKRTAMIKELTDPAVGVGIKPQDALNAVNMLLKLPITTTVEEFQIRDLDVVAGSLSKLAIEGVARFIEAWRSK